MGALHDGHVALIRRARGDDEPVLVSIFVNPWQFGPSEDLSKYPRDEATDFEICSREGVDAVFAPTPETMRIAGDTRVVVGDVASRYEGAFRPGHFEGVATIVLKLFNLCRPARAYFGLKDLQQCAVVARMVGDLDVPVDLVFVETVREETGLARSSRNAYFDSMQRKQAARLFGVIDELARSQALARSLGLPERGLLIDSAKSELAESGFDVEYLDVVEWRTMTSAPHLRSDLRVVVAARFHGVRLIDNVPFIAQGNLEH